MKRITVLFFATTLILTGCYSGASVTDSRKAIEEFYVEVGEENYNQNTSQLEGMAEYRYTSMNAQGEIYTTRLYVISKDGDEATFQKNVEDENAKLFGAFCSAKKTYLVITREYDRKYEFEKEDKDALKKLSRKANCKLKYVDL